MLRRPLTSLELKPEDREELEEAKARAASQKKQERGGVEGKHAGGEKGESEAVGIGESSARRQTVASRIGLGSAA